MHSLSKLIEDKFVSLEACIVSVEDQINKHHEQLIYIMINNIDQKVNSALTLVTSNSKVIAANTERISSQQFDYQSLIERTETLETHKLEESKNRSMSKTLIFKNIRQPQKRESWIKQN